MRIVAFFVFCCFFFSCQERSVDSNLAIFKYNESAGISSLDPAFSKDQANIWATSQLFNGLVQLDKDLNVTPAIASHWQVSDDNLNYTFYLRKDVYFHVHELFPDLNSRQVKANDFSYSFSRLKDPKLASPGAWVLNNVGSYSAVNDSVFQISLKSPFPPFLGLLSMPYCSVVPKVIVENRAFRDEPVGTGPFKFQFWKENVKLVLRKNKDYFEKDLPHLDAVAVTFIKDKQTAFLEFIKGNLDFISGLDASYKDEVLTRAGELQDFYKDKINLQSLPYLNTEYLGFLMDDNNLSPSQQLSVRKAINYGFDRSKMIKYLRNNIGEPAEFGFVPKGLPSFSEEVKGYTYQPKLAKEFIEKANLDDNHQLVLHTTSSYVDICEFIQNQLQELGLNLQISISPPSTHRQMVATSKLDFFRGSWIADYADAENYLALFYSENFCPNGPNYTHFSSDAYDRLYERAREENNIQQRNILYQKMDQIIMDNAAVVPLYYDQVLRFVQKDIQGFEGNAMNMLNLKRVIK
jgi:ABC-type transport system substrate-binding protein